MAKKKTNKPNLPQDVLERARQQAVEGTEAAPQTAPQPSTPKKSGTTASQRSAERAKRRQASGSGQSTARRRVQEEPIQFSKDRRRRPVDENDTEYIAEKLANPTITVTSEQMRAEYGHVLRDIRNMFLLAAVLFAMLIVLAQLFV